ncbi:putative MFS transporter [Xylariales sp. PMI_506]|nr:putative MFS transporter [Xylariales sp. PMI_506]
MDPDNNKPAKPGKDAQGRMYWVPVWIVISMLLIDGLGYSIAQAPTVQLYEDMVCRHYYQAPLGVNDGQLCKIPAVQSEVASIFGWQAFFDGIPGLLLALWYGALTDQHGRRGVLFLSMVGQVLGLIWVLLICWMELPLKLTWFSSIFLVIGGGSTVTRAAAMTVVTDATPEASRSKIFFLCQSIFLISEPVGPAVGSFLMERYGSWPPMLIQLLCTCITAFLAASTPETMHYQKKTRDPAWQQDSEPVSFQKESLVDTLQEMWTYIVSTFREMCLHESVLFLVLSFLVVDFSRQSLGILIQYISVRYAVPIAQANLLLSYKAIATLVTFSVILPSLDIMCQRVLRLSARAKDLHLARLSLSMSVLGFGVLIVAPSLPFVVLALALTTVGIGFASFVRSLLSSLVDSNIIGTLYTTLAIMDGIGSILAGPIVAKLFSWSMQLDGIWAGMPFISSLILCSIVFILLFKVRAADLDAPVDKVDDDESRALFSQNDAESETSTLA